jgi:hypothetical protein
MLAISATVRKSSGIREDATRGAKGQSHVWLADWADARRPHKLEDRPSLRLLAATCQKAAKAMKLVRSAVVEHRLACDPTQWRKRAEHAADGTEHTFPCQRLKGAEGRIVARDRCPSLLGASWGPICHEEPA